MADERAAILGRVKAALGQLPQRAALPEYDAELAVVRKLLAQRDLFEVFAERIQLVHGEAQSDPEAVARRLREGGWMKGYCDPDLWPRLAPYFAGFKVETAFDRTRIDDYDFGITRAAGAIAESGTIVLNDATTSCRLGALAPWVHVAVIALADLHPDLPHAVSKLGDDPNVIWCTGPSKTADIEGILIEGVHGPGVQIALVLD
ncbi:MAG TPA: LUD domain-containing protein [Opitutaceae bacterium]|nr:LUD domain-containing protein [Opitutaceae bacterium]